MNHVRVFLAVASFFLTGCFYPPTTQLPPDEKTQTTVALPYDLTWTAVNEVIRQNDYMVQATDPNHGIIEVLGKRFTLQDADCGRIKSIAGTYAAEPETSGTSVYNFRVKALSNESSLVEVRASYDSPLRVPLHMAQDVECVSRGTQESRLLQQVLAQAKITRPPVYKKPGEEEAPQPAPTPLRGRPTLLKPDALKGLGQPSNEPRN